MKKLTTFVTTLFLLCSVSSSLAAIDPPVVSTSTDGLDITIDWTSVSGATGYTLYYAPVTDGEYGTISSKDMGASTTFNYILWEGASYAVAVKAYNNQESSPYSNIEKITIPYTVPESPPLSYTLDEKNLSVTWDAVPGATGYKLYYTLSDYTGQEAFLPVDVGNQTSFSYQGLAEEQTYSIAVVAYNKLGEESDLSNVETFRAGPPINITKYVKVPYTISSTKTFKIIDGATNGATTVRTTETNNGRGEVTIKFYYSDDRAFWNYPVGCPDVYTYIEKADGRYIKSGKNYNIYRKSYGSYYGCELYQEVSWVEPVMVFPYGDKYFGQPWGGSYELKGARYYPFKDFYSKATKHINEEQSRDNQIVNLETVTVQGVEYKNVLRFRRITYTGNRVDFWYAEGVGLIKEQGAGWTWELINYSTN